MKTSVTALGLALLVAACKSEGPAEPPATVDTPDASAPDAPVEAAAVVPPYPAGPYGLGVGDVMPNISVQGYRLTRVNRDASKLPFETIQLGDVRADATCTHVLVLWDWAGAILTCTEMRNALAQLVASDPTFCGFEIVAHAAGAAPSGTDPSTVPPTRGDVDSTVAEAREPFVVGMSTSSIHDGGFEEIPFFPDLFVVKKDDMRIVAMIQGAGNTPQRVREAIAKPWNARETLAKNLDHPAGLIVDDTLAYFYEAKAGIRSIPVAGGAPTTLAPLATPPTSLLADATHVYWSTNIAAGTSVVARAPKAGGATETLTSGAAGYTSIALDGATVWLTRTDGFVGSVPATGGAETSLVTGEDKPTTIGASATDLYWVAGGQVVTMPKAGGPRTVAIAPADIEAEYQTYSDRKTPVSIVGNRVAGDALWASFDFGAPLNNHGVTHRLIDKSANHYCTYPYAITPPAFSPTTDAYVAGSNGVGGMIMRMPNDGAYDRAILDLGLRGVGGVAVSAKHAYWIDGADGASAVLHRIALP